MNDSPPDDFKPAAVPDDGGRRTDSFFILNHFNISQQPFNISYATTATRLSRWTAQVLMQWLYSSAQWHHWWLCVNINLSFLWFDYFWSCDRWVGLHISWWCIISPIHTGEDAFSPGRWVANSPLMVIHTERSISAFPSVIHIESCAAAPKRRDGPCHDDDVCVFSRCPPINLTPSLARTEAVFWGRLH